MSEEEYQKLQRDIARALDEALAEAERDEALATTAEGGEE